jgi:hypothetical protein
VVCGGWCVWVWCVGVGVGVWCVVSVCGCVGVGVGVWGVPHAAWSKKHCCHAAKHHRQGA